MPDDVLSIPSAAPEQGCGFMGCGHPDCADVCNPSRFTPGGPEPRRILMTEPYDGHPATEECPGCPHKPSRLSPATTTEGGSDGHA